MDHALVPGEAEVVRYVAQGNTFEEFVLQGLDALTAGNDLLQCFIGKVEIHGAPNGDVP